MKKTSLRLLPLVLLALLIALPAFAEEVYPIACVSSTYNIHSDSSDHSSTVNWYYDERGLISAMETAQDGGDPQSPRIVYTFDDQGNPETVSFESEEETLELRLENTYANLGPFGSALMAVDAAQIRLNGENAFTDDAFAHPESLSTAQASTLQSILNLLRNFTGYRNMTLTVGCDEVRYEGGKQVYSRFSYAGFTQENIASYPEAGGRTETTRISTWADDAWQEDSATVIETGADNFVRALGFGAGGELITLPIRYEDAVDEETGAAQKLGYLDASALPESDDDDDDLYEVYLRYTLDAEGRPEKLEYLPSNLALYYDEAGRTIRQETWNGEEMLQLTVYTYR